MDALGVDVVEHRVERRRLAAAGRPGDQDDALGAGDHQLQALQVLVGEAEIVERDNAFLAVENAQHDILAVDGRLAGDTEIHLAAGHRQPDAAVLRGAHFGDIHAGKHLDAHRHRRPVGFVQGTDLAQHAVDAVTDAQKIGLRLEVDVGDFALDGVGEDRVDQADDRLAVFVVGRRQAFPVDLAGFDFLQDAVDRQFVAVILVDGAVDLGFAGNQRFDLDVFGHQGAHPVEADDVVDVGNRQRQAVVGGVIVEW